MKASIKRKKLFLMICGVSFNLMNDLFDKILVFDLDDTIIDTRKIKSILFGIANELGVEAEAMQEIYKRVRDSGFTLEKFAQELGLVTGREESEIKRRMEQAILGKKDELLFSDAKVFLALCREHKTEMHLLTFGAEGWQREKIGLFGLGELFPNTVPTEDEKEGKLGELSAIIGVGDGAGVVLFNDKLDEIKAALRRFPRLLAFWRNGKEGAVEVLADMDEEMRKQIKSFFDFREIFSEVYDGERK